jgi:5-methylcytosine-specific restriction enzyme A
MLMARKAWNHNGKTRQQRGYGREHERIRAELLRDVILCEQCTRHGRVTAGWIADHIVPLAKGGSGDRSNYQLLCRDCGAEKDAADRGATLKPKSGSDASGYPTDPRHPWNRHPGGSSNNPTGEPCRSAVPSKTFANTRKARR